MSDVAERRSFVLPLAVVALATFFLLGPSRAEEPGTGATAIVERQFLEEAIDHHYAALRMAEIAVGAEIDGGAIGADGIALVKPATTAGNAKATKPEILALARRNHRAQREEIAVARRFLRDWYETDHEPALSATGERMLAHLEQVPAGEAFDVEFLKTFSMHHAAILIPTLRCLIGADLDHRELDRHCHEILRGQLADIEEMRGLLCTHYDQCGFAVPL